VDLLVEYECGAIFHPSVAHSPLKLTLDFVCSIRRVVTSLTLAPRIAPLGSWTAALRRHGCFVNAVDRSELDAEVMADTGVAFVEVNKHRILWPQHACPTPTLAL